MYDINDGTFLVKLARDSMDKKVRLDIKNRRPTNVGEKMLEKTGVFVTLHRFPSNELRGCIGIPEPIYPLVDATIDSAISAAIADPRFKPMGEGELDKVSVEVSILTKPELISVNNYAEYPDRIEIGKDGLVVEYGPFRGLLLPQVPVEWKWDKEKFLEQACLKAGLPPMKWREKSTKIYKFQSVIFREKRPNGEVVQVLGE